MVGSDAWIRRAAIVLALGFALLAAQTARATTVFQEITSATGPLTGIWLGNDLDCQVQYAGEAAYEFYPSGTAPGDCGTFVSINGAAGAAATLYGPDFSTNAVTATPFIDGSGYTPFTNTSQSGITGAGSTASPYAVTTDVTAASGLSVAQTDSYVPGDTYFRTDITLHNSGTTTLSGELYRAADCYLQGSDAGYGEVNASDSAPACTQAPNNSPPGLVEEFAPLTAGNHYVETGYATVWVDIGAQTDLPNTCDCTTDEDNGTGINWDYSIPAGGSQTFSLLTNFSSSGALVGSPIDETAPGVTGAALVGDTLTESHGTWANTPTAYAYQWEDCDALGANCVAIAGAIGPSYTVAAGDLGHTIRVVETASNGDGPGEPAVSPATTVVALPPQPVTLTTTQTAGKHSGRSLSIPAGTTGETDRATLTGSNAAQATGSINYALYSKSSCVASSAVYRSPTRTVSGSVAPASSAVSKVLVAGTYYWRATYSGDPRNQPATSPCGAEILKVTAATSAKGTATAGLTFIVVKVSCKIVPCRLKVVLTATVKVKTKAAIARVAKKRPKFRKVSLIVATDSVRIKRSGDVAVDSRLTRKGRQYLADQRSRLKNRRGHVKLTLKISETVKGTTLVSETTLNVAIAKTPSTPSGERPI